MAVSKPIGCLGIEFEFQGLTQREMATLLSKTGLDGIFNIHHDASIDQSRHVLSSLPYLSFGNIDPNSSQYFNSATCGAEVVSQVIDTSDNTRWKKDVALLLNILRGLGESPSPLTSIHFHVNGKGLPIHAVQNILRLWMQTEAPFFRLGIGESDIHRGEIRRDQQFCRPYRHPHVVKSGDTNRFSYSVDKMLQASNLREFFIAYGNVNIDRDSHKYHPARYSAVNFFPLNSIGSVEFRVCNMTTNPNYIFAWAEAFQQLVILSLGKPFEIGPELPLGYNGNFDFGNFVVKLELSDRTALDLENIWNQTTWVKPVQGEMFTHSGMNQIDWPSPDFQPDEVLEFCMWDSDEHYTVIPSRRGRNSSRTSEIHGDISTPTQPTMIRNDNYRELRFNPNGYVGYVQNPPANGNIVTTGNTSQIEMTNPVEANSFSWTENEEEIRNRMATEEMLSETIRRNNDRRSR